jgi:hypothetical protein
MMAMKDYGYLRTIVTTVSGNFTFVYYVRSESQSTFQVLHHAFLSFTLRYTYLYSPQNIPYDFYPRKASANIYLTQYASP